MQKKPEISRREFHSISYLYDFKRILSDGKNIIKSTKVIRNAAEKNIMRVKNIIKIKGRIKIETVRALEDQGYLVILVG